MPTVYPGAIDVLTNPTATTRRDDPGFELDIVIATLNDIAEITETKLGISEAAAADTPLANTVLQSLTNGHSKWATIVTAMLAAGAISSITSLSLGNFSASASGPTLIATLNTPSWVGPNGLVLLAENASHAQDGAGETWSYQTDSGAQTDFIGPRSHNGANYFNSVFGVYPITGLAAGSHAHKFYYRTTTSGVSYTLSGGFFVILELKK